MLKIGQCCAVAVAVMGLSAGFAQATLLAQEQFNYASGSLAGNGPAAPSGFGRNSLSDTTEGKWYDTLATGTQVQVNSTGLTYGTGANVLSVAGGAAQLNIVASQPQRTQINLSTLAVDNSPFAHFGYVDANENIGADGKTLYLSFLLRTTDIKATFYLEAHRDGTADANRVWGIGHIDGDNVKFGVGPALGDRQTFGKSTKNLTQLFVLKFEFGEGDNDSVSGYLNPVPGEAEPVPMWTASGLGNLSFDNLSLYASSSAWIATVDEIRIGTTFADVTSTTPQTIWTPEPSAMAVLGLGALGLMRRRRA